MSVSMEPIVARRSQLSSVVVPNVEEPGQQQRGGAAAVELTACVQGICSLAESHHAEQENAEPDDAVEAWVQCDGACKGWYHARCEGFDALDMRQYFRCSQCSRVPNTDPYNVASVESPATTARELFPEVLTEASGVESAKNIAANETSPTNQRTAATPSCGGNSLTPVRPQPRTTRFSTPPPGDSGSFGGGSREVYRTPTSYKGSARSLRTLLRSCGPRMQSSASSVRTTFHIEDETSNSGVPPGDDNGGAKTPPSMSPRFGRLSSATTQQSQTGGPDRVRTTPRRTARLRSVQQEAGSPFRSSSHNNNIESPRGQTRGLRPLERPIQSGVAIVEEPTPTLLLSPSKLPGRHGQDLVAARNCTLVEGGGGGKGKYGRVYIVKTPDGSMFAVKRQLVLNPHALDDVAHRELVIHQELARVTRTRGCVNWAALVDWYKIHPPLFPQPSGSAKSPLPRSDDQYMHYVMEKADCTFAKLKGKLSVDIYRSVIFQVVYALALLQEELEFVHNDLHGHNILLKSMDEDETLSLTWPAPRLTGVVRAALLDSNDGPLSNVPCRTWKLPDGRGVWNPKNQAPVFDSEHDTRSLAFVMRSRKVDWTADRESRMHHNHLLAAIDTPGNASPAALLQHPFFEAMLLSGSSEEDVDVVTF